jgi:hypothetical protein
MDFEGISAFATDRAVEICHLLAQHSHQNAAIIDRLNAQLQQEEYVRRSASGVVGADGTVEISVAARPGFLMQLHGLATTQVTAGTGAVAFYFDSTGDGQNLLYAKAGATLLSDSFPVGTVLQENSTLIARFTGLTAGDRVTASVTASRLGLHEPVAVAGVPY